MFHVYVVVYRMVYVVYEMVYAKISLKKNSSTSCDVSPIFPKKIISLRKRRKLHICQVETAQIDIDGGGNTERL
jgi:hypothetical protein